MIYGLLLLLSSLAYHTSSMLIDPNPTMKANTSNRIEPRCFTPETSPDVGETNQNDCRDALLILARTRGFTNPYQFSKDPRRGVRLPLVWKSRECVIFVNCENDHDAYTFRFADVLVVAKRLVDVCVGTHESERWGLLRWGGLDGLGDSETFYVSVGYPLPLVSAAGSVIPVELVNGTLLDSATGVS